MCVAYFVLHVFLSRLICPQDTVGYGEMSSPHDVIDVVIEWKTKKPRQMIYDTVGAGVGFWIG